MNNDSPILMSIAPVTHDLGGFKVHRTLPHKMRTMVGPFIFFDQMGPARLTAGEGIDRTRNRAGIRKVDGPRERRVVPAAGVEDLLGSCVAEVGTASDRRRRRKVVMQRVEDGDRSKCGSGWADVVRVNVVVAWQDARSAFVSP